MSRCSPPAYQEFNAQEVPLTFVDPHPAPLPAECLQGGALDGISMPAHEQDDIPGEFKPTVRTRASSVKVISGIFGAMAGLPLTLHSDVTGRQYKMRFVGEVQMNHHDASNFIAS